MKKLAKLCLCGGLLFPMLAFGAFDFQDAANKATDAYKTV